MYLDIKKQEVDAMDFIRFHYEAQFVGLNLLVARNLASLKKIAESGISAIDQQDLGRFERLLEYIKSIISFLEWRLEPKGNLSMSLLELAVDVEFLRHIMHWKSKKIPDHSEVLEKMRHIERLLESCHKRENMDVEALNESIEFLDNWEHFLLREVQISLQGDSSFFTLYHELSAHSSGESIHQHYAYT
jgi:hypothetical protein